MMTMLRSLEARAPGEPPGAPRLGWLSRFVGRSRTDAATAIGRHIERSFLYRGSSSLQLRRLEVAGGRVDVAFYARPAFAGGSRTGHRDREQVFAEQLFADAVRVLEAVWEAAPDVTVATLEVWTHPVNAPDAELRLLATSATALQARHLLGRRGPAWRLAPLERLRRLPTRVRIDRHGAFHDERAL
jgi:hypothetical protein